MPGNLTHSDQIRRALPTGRDASRPVTGSLCHTIVTFLLQDRNNRSLRCASRLANS